MLNTAIRAAKEAGKLVLKGFNKKYKISYKKLREPVTEYDRKSERIISRILREKFPDHKIIGEEYGTQEGKNKKSDFCWYIDPIDGTKNYIRKVPLFVVSIGLAYKGEFILGVIYAPALNEVYYAEKGKGAYLNNKKIKVSDTRSIIDSMIGVGWGRNKKLVREGMRLNTKIGLSARRLRSYGSTALMLGYLASGSVDAYLRNYTRMVDIAAGFVIAKEAGAKLTRLNGRPWKIGDPDFLISNKKLHSKIKNIIKR